PTGTVDKLVDDIEAELYNLGKTEVPSTAIGDMVMDRLKGLDYIAYIRFASVYRSFTDITDLKQAVDSLIGSQAEISGRVSQLPLIPDDRLVLSRRTYRRKVKGPKVEADRSRDNRILSKSNARTRSSK
ncbi:MAG: ATP cone domain-containing protein, partial [Dehalococcoidales bacterium]|nr:ATP cone domain-containing protein [Dehalococcoidales bacterium]